MHRLETCQPDRGASRRRQTGPATHCLLDGSSSGLAAADRLMPPGGTGAVPRLEGIPSEYRFAGGIDAASRLALTLVSAGLANANQWARAPRDPFAFIGHALKDFVE